MYDPQIGRWFVPDHANQYWSGYVGMGNNPVRNVDSDGRIVQLAPGATGFIIGAGLAAYDIYLDPNQDFSSYSSWARIGTSGVAGAAMAYVPASWGGYGYLASGAGSGLANACDQVIKNNGTSQFNVETNLSTTVGGMFGYGIGNYMTKLFTPGNMGYSLIVRNASLSVNFHDKAVQTFMERLSLYSGGITGSWIGGWTGNAVTNIMMDEITVVGHKLEPAIESLSKQLEMKINEQK